MPLVSETNVPSLLISLFRWQIYKIYHFHQIKQKKKCRNVAKNAPEKNLSSPRRLSVDATYLSLGRGLKIVNGLLTISNLLFF